jgi:hypothetical protein
MTQYVKIILVAVLRIYSRRSEGIGNSHGGAGPHRKLSTFEACTETSKGTSLA